MWQEELSKVFDWESIFGADSDAKKGVIDFITDLRKKDMENLLEQIPLAMKRSRKVIQEYYKYSN